MTLDEAIIHAEEIADSKCDKCGQEHRQLASWLKELKEYKERELEWTPIKWRPHGKNGYPKPEDEYKYFLTIDNHGEITIQEFLLSLDEEPQPYFTGMRNIVAWMPLPKPYQEEENEHN